MAVCAVEDPSHVPYWMADTDSPLSLERELQREVILAVTVECVIKKGVQGDDGIQ